jgi:hypothetical protein
LNYLVTTRRLLQAFCRFHDNVKPGGHVIFDMITDQPPPHGARPHIERTAIGNCRIERENLWHADRSVQTALVSIARRGRVHRELHVQRGYPVTAVKSLVVHARLRIRGVHDFETLRAATAWTHRCVFVATRPAEPVGGTGAQCLQ